MFKNLPFRPTLLLIIVITTVIRCVLAAMLNLGNDEVYYFTYAVQPDWNHFDHPPLVGLFIRLFTFNLHWINDLSLRLPAITGAAFNTWLIAQCGLKLKNKEAGLIAATLYNTSIYTSIISGLFIMPDSVQVVFWLAALFTMLQITDDGLAFKRNKYLLWLGCWIGLATMCKVHGVFLWIGFLGFVLTNRPDWLKNPYLYLSGLITVLIISPIMIWNIQNDFISWQFHSERVVADRGINLKSFFTTTIGQIAYNNPFNFVIGVLALTALRKPDKYLSRSKLRLLLWCSLPIIAATTLVSLFRPTLPHWSGPGFTALLILSSVFLGSWQASAYSRLLQFTAGFTIAVVMAATALINFHPGTIGSEEPAKLGSGDPTMDMYGWNELLPEFQKIRLRDIAHGTMPEDAPLAIHKWFPGAHLYHYIAYPAGMRTVGLGTLLDLHKFIWLNKIYGGIQPGTDAYFISPSNDFTDPAMRYQNQFKSVQLAGKIACLRNGKTARYWHVYRLKSAL